MRKGLWFIPLLLLFLTVPAYAVFDTSHHDLRTYDNSTQGCYHCHGRLVTTSVDNATATAAGAVGSLCLGRCHAVGVGIYTTEPGNVQPDPPSYPQDNGTFTWVNPAPSYTAVLFTNSHGRAKGVAGTNISGVFPYDTAASPANIECTSCHSVHDDANSPFIWRQMATPPGNHPGSSAPASSTLTTGLCDSCHRDKADLGGSFATNRSAGGNHPVDIFVDNAAASTRTGGLSATFRTQRHGRRIQFDYAAYGNNRAFDVVTPAGATLRAAAGTAGTSWITGGKVWNGTNTYGAVTYGPSGSVMGCYTCHSAHRTIAGGGNNLVNVSFQDQSTGHGYNPICVGCHGNVDNWVNDKQTWDVGVSNFGHPNADNSANTGTSGQYTTSAGGFTFMVTTATSIPWPQGTNGRIMCSSCHDVHNGVAGSMAIRNLGQTTTAVICKQCHSGVGFPNVNDISKGGGGEAANAHHRTATSVTIGQHTPANESTPITIATPTWAATAPLGLGNIGTGGMDCADCHVFNGTAHNW